MSSNTMSYKQIKWLILVIPTVAVGLWEYVRHTPFMLGHLSMVAGHWLTPVIVFAVTVIFVRKLFLLLEETHRKLEEEKARKAMLEEREKMARELHDGLAQSLFLLSVRLNQWEVKDPDIVNQEHYQKIRKTIQHIHEDVRQSIFNLRHAADAHPSPWMESLQQFIAGLRQETGLRVTFDWNIPEEKLSSKEKVELYACIKEALMNIRKHAQASQAAIRGHLLGDDQWICYVEDDGIGFAEAAERGSDEQNAAVKGGYGMEIMRDRAKEMNWKINWQRIDGMTRVTIQNGDADESRAENGSG